MESSGTYCWNKSTQTSEDAPFELDSTFWIKLFVQVCFLSHENHQVKVQLHNPPSPSGPNKLEKHIYFHLDLT